MDGTILFVQKRSY